MTINSLSANKTVAVNQPNNDRHDSTRTEPRIIVAAKDADIDELLSAIDDNVNINVKDSRGYTSLMILADLGDLEGVKLLLKKGADVKVESSGEGYTALMIAANSINHFNKEFAVLSALIDADPSPEHIDHACPKGVTAFMLAVHAGKQELALKLRNAGADVNKKNSDGLSALSYASGEGNYETVLWLMEQKGWFSKEQVRGALDFAQSERVKGILKASLKPKRGNFIVDSSMPQVTLQVGKRSPPLFDDSDTNLIVEKNRGLEVAENISAPSPRATEILSRPNSGPATAPEDFAPGRGLVRKLPLLEDDDQVRHPDKKSKPNNSGQDSPDGQVVLP